MFECVCGLWALDGCVDAISRREMEIFSFANCAANVDKNRIFSLPFIRRLILLFTFSI